MGSVPASVAAARGSLWGGKLVTRLYSSGALFILVKSQGVMATDSVYACKSTTIGGATPRPTLRQSPAPAVALFHARPRRGVSREWELGRLRRSYCLGHCCDAVGREVAAPTANPQRTGSRQQGYICRVRKVRRRLEGWLAPGPVISLCEGVWWPVPYRREEQVRGLGRVAG